MTHIIMAQTIPLVCKTQEEFDFLIGQGWKLKKTKDGLQYLFKKEENNENNYSE
jgi:hypothetical protein